MVFKERRKWHGVVAGKGVAIERDKKKQMKEDALYVEWRRMSDAITGLLGNCKLANEIFKRKVVKYE
jgi:hypothetical protein